jgi:hypothetical protein
MVRQLDQILVIDVESTCWQGKTPAGQVSGIIEIGVCPVDTSTPISFSARAATLQSGTAS